MSQGLKLRIAVGLVLVFLAGVASGVFAAAWHAHRTFARRHGPQMAERMRARLIDELDLSPAQVRELSPILDDTAQRLQQIRRETAQRVSATMSQSHQEMVAHLTPEQQARFRAMMQQRPRRFWRWHQRAAAPADRP